MPKVTSVYHGPGKGRGQEGGSRRPAFPSDSLTWCPVATSDDSNNEAEVTALAQGPRRGRSGSLQGPCPMALKLWKGHTCGPQTRALG